MSEYPFEVDDCVEEQIPIVPLEELPPGLIADEM